MGEPELAQNKLLTVFLTVLCSWIQMLVLVSAQSMEVEYTLVGEQLHSSSLLLAEGGWACISCLSLTPLVWLLHFSWVVTKFWEPDFALGFGLKPLEASIASHSSFSWTWVLLSLARLLPRFYYGMALSCFFQTVRLLVYLGQSYNFPLTISAAFSLRQRSWEGLNLP